MLDQKFVPNSRCGECLAVHDEDVSLRTDGSCPCCDIKHRGNKISTEPLKWFAILYLLALLCSHAYAAECHAISLEPYQFLNHSCKLFEARHEEFGQTIIVKKVGTTKEERLTCSEAKPVGDGTYGVYSHLAKESFYCNMGDTRDRTQTPGSGTDDQARPRPRSFTRRDRLSNDRDVT